MRKKNKGGNRMRLYLPAVSVNEGIARAAVAAFCAQCDPDATELADKINAGSLPFAMTVDKDKLQILYLKIFLFLHLHQQTIRYKLCKDIQTHIYHQTSR